MTEQELRALVREAIARQVGVGAATAPALPAAECRHHASHATFILSVGSDTEGPCLIEPAVPCNHCGYCRSYGH